VARFDAPELLKFVGAGGNYANATPRRLISAGPMLLQSSSLVGVMVKSTRSPSKRLAKAP
ncbi:MAG TPA: hypothetical protein VHN11_05845, partial [Xanthobacteraceae bacterium]|nr:hypothetical protein [Xanthobacteraceae bacterium]